MSPARWRLELGPQYNLGAVLIYCGAAVKQPPPTSALSTTLENFMPLKHPPETESSGALEWLTTHFLGLLPEYSAFIHSNSCFLSTQTKHRIPFLEIIFFHYFLLAHWLCRWGGFTVTSSMEMSSTDLLGSAPAPFSVSSWSLTVSLPLPSLLVFFVFKFMPKAFPK